MNNETILITGMGGGIGKTLSKDLLEDGYSIIALGRENTKNYAEQLISSGENVEFIKCDYTSENSVTKAMKDAKQFTNEIKGAIHLVGGSLITKSIENLSYNQFKEVIEVNLGSAFLFGREVVKWLKSTGGGNLIFFGSTTGIEPSEGKMPYGTSKAAVHYMTRSFALETSKYNIITNTIAPSYVMTPKHKNDVEQKVKKEKVDRSEIISRLKDKNPLNRILEPEDLSPIVDLLLKTKSIQGQVIRIDLGQVGI